MTNSSGPPSRGRLRRLGGREDARDGGALLRELVGEDLHLGILWMVAKSTSHYLETMVETSAFVGIYRGIIRNQGFLGGAGFRPGPPESLE